MKCAISSRSNAVLNTIKSACIGCAASLVLFGVSSAQTGVYDNLIRDVARDAVIERRGGPTIVELLWWDYAYPSPFIISGFVLVLGIVVGLLLRIVILRLDDSRNERWTKSIHWAAIVALIIPAVALNGAAT